MRLGLLPLNVFKKVASKIELWRDARSEPGRRFCCDKVWEEGRERDQKREGQSGKTGVLPFVFSLLYLSFVPSLWPSSSPESPSRLEPSLLVPCPLSPTFSRGKLLLARQQGRKAGFSSVESSKEIDSRDERSMRGTRSEDRLLTARWSKRFCCRSSKPHTQ